ncbi:unnamed protein product [Tenebrio molitor]|nr:unnamed protein product [Tenebrio molitor]
MQYASDNDYEIKLNLWVVINSGVVCGDRSRWILYLFKKLNNYTRVNLTVGFSTRWARGW